MRWFKVKLTCISNASKLKPLWICTLCMWREMKDIECIERIIWCRHQSWITMETRLSLASLSASLSYMRCDEVLICAVLTVVLDLSYRITCEHAKSPTIEMKIHSPLIFYIFSSNEWTTRDWLNTGGRQQKVEFGGQWCISITELWNNLQLKAFS